MVNAQSVRNKVDIIHDLIVGDDLDVLAITEHWLSDKDKDIVYINSHPRDIRYIMCQVQKAIEVLLLYTGVHSSYYPITL